MSGNRIRVLSSGLAAAVLAAVVPDKAEPGKLEESDARESLKDFESVRIHPDRKVTFRLPAPKASEVSVWVDTMHAKETPLKKGSDGVWSVILGPFQPEVSTPNGLAGWDRSRQRCTPRNSKRISRSC